MSDYSETDLTQEIQAVIDNAMKCGKPTPAAWVAHEVIMGKAPAEGEDAPFWTFTGSRHVRDKVHKNIARRKRGEDVGMDLQDELPGFEGLPKTYIIRRDGEETIVPIGKCTDHELRTKAAYYRSMGAGCFDHADALDRYVDRREAEVASH